MRKWICSAAKNALAVVKANASPHAFNEVGRCNKLGAKCILGGLLGFPSQVPGQLPKVVGELLNVLRDGVVWAVGHASLLVMMAGHHDTQVAGTDP